MKKPTIKIVKFYQSLDPSSCMRVKVGSVEGKYSEWLTNYKRKKKSQITRSQDISIFFQVLNSGLHSSQVTLLAPNRRIIKSELLLF